MLRKMPSDVPLPSRFQWFLWTLAVSDVMVVAWMLSAGEWLDRNAPVVTLGGHHSVVLWLAVAGFVLDRAREKGLGRDLPADWFAQTLLP